MIGIHRSVRGLEVLIEGKCDFISGRWQTGEFGTENGAFELTIRHNGAVPHVLYPVIHFPCHRTVHHVANPDAEPRFGIVRQFKSFGNDRRNGICSGHREHHRRSRLGFASLVGDIHIKLEHTALITCAPERCSGEGYDEFAVGTCNGFRCKRCALCVAVPPPRLTVRDLVRHLCAGHRHARVCKGLSAYPDSIARHALALGAGCHHAERRRLVIGNGK